MLMNIWSLIPAHAPGRTHFCFKGCLLLHWTFQKSHFFLLLILCWRKHDGYEAKFFKCLDWAMPLAEARANFRTDMAVLPSVGREWYHYTIITAFEPGLHNGGLHNTSSMSCQSIRAQYGDGWSKVGVASCGHGSTANTVQCYGKTMRSWHSGSLCFSYW